MQFSSKAIERAHRFHVYNDPDFIAEIKKLPARSTDKILAIYKQYHRIGKQFGIPTVYVDFAHERDGHNFSAEKDIGSWSVWLNSELDKIQAEMGINITREHILDLYDRIVELREENNIKPTKYRLPEYHDLLYAVFKAKKSGKSMPEIHKLYMDNRLPHYAVSPVRAFYTVAELYKYYKRYYQEDKQTP